MKIIGGKFKGRNFYMPKGIKPTQNLVREALFDILGQDLEGQSFVDLFAGSGAVGIEALSRGAKKVIMVEKDPRCCEIIHENLKLLSPDQKYGMVTGCEVINSDAFASVKMLSKRRSKSDIIFFDPPFGRGLAKKTLKTLMAYDIVQPTCIILIQYSGPESLPDAHERFTLLKERRYGRSFLAIYQPNHT